MGLIKDVRSVTLPDGNLAWRDKQSQLKMIQTGKFTRNCVLTGKSSPINDYPLYIRTPGLITVPYSLSLDDLGYLEASEGTAENACPGHKDLTLDTTYWNGTQLGCWLAYHHITRPTMIRGYRFITENGYTPRVWRVEGSNDNITWTTLHAVTVDWTWGSGKQLVEYDIPTENRDYFTHHRLIIDEFDATSVRIYSLQFWDAACPSSADIYLDADAENPLQLAFADGYNPDGTPKDILKTIASPSIISADALYPSLAQLQLTNPYTGILFAKYDPQTDIVTFEVEDYSEEFKPLNLVGQMMRVATSGSVINPDAVFDGNTSTLFTSDDGSGVTAGSVTFQPPTPFYARRAKIWYTCLYNVNIQISEDYGATWTTVFSHSSSFSSMRAEIITFDRVYYVTQVKFYVSTYNGSRRGFYECVFDDALQPHYRKMMDGKFYEYNDVTQEWVQEYKIPIGYVIFRRNPDDTAWEIAHFIPNWVPNMLSAPAFLKLSAVSPA